MSESFKNLNKSASKTYNAKRVAWYILLTTAHRWAGNSLSVTEQIISSVTNQRTVSVIERWKTYANSSYKQLRISLGRRHSAGFSLEANDLLTTVTPYYDYKKPAQCLTKPAIAVPLLSQYCSSFVSNTAQFECNFGLKPYLWFQIQLALRVRSILKSRVWF